MANARVIDVAEPTSESETPEALTSQEAALAEPTSNTVSLELDLDLIPEKFRKDPTKVFNSYNELEVELGRQRNVTGTYRGLVEELSSIKRQADLAQTQDTQPNVTSDSLLENPDESITSIVRRELEARLKPTEEALALSAQEQELQKFQSSYPDFETDARTEQFAEFVRKRPTRGEDAQRASQGDLQAARRLMDNYSDYKEMSAPAAAPTSSAPTGVKGARRVATEKSGAGGTTTGKKFVYQRDVVNTIMQDPDLYRSQHFQDDLKSAIAEGRYRK